MSAQKASGPVRFAGLAAAAVLIVLAGAVAVHLAGRRGALRPAAVKPPPEDRVVDRKEQVRHKEYKEGKLVSDIRGDSFFLGPDSRNHLRGAVEISNFGPAGEVVSRLTADEVVYDPGAVRFTVAGRVRVEAGGVVLEGGSFDYDKANGLFRTTFGGAFSSKTMTGRAEEVSYVESADEVLLSGGFRVGLAAAGRAGETIVLAGDSFLYRRRERRGRVEGGADFSGGRCRGEARSLSFAAAEDESAIESAVFDGAVRVVFTGNAPGAPESGGVHADRVEVSFTPGTGLVSSVEAGGNACLSLRSPAGPGTLVRASAAALTFGADGELAKWSASGGFRAEFGEGDDRGRILEGESAAYDAPARILRASGMPGRPAVADSPEARVEAASISAGPAEGDLEASGGVKGLLKPGEGSRGAGFFSAGTAVFVFSESLVFRGGAGSASFTGDVRAWQDKEFLLAGELEFSEASGEMRGRGGVAAGLTRPATGNTPERRVELGGEEMAFSAADRTLSFTEKSYVQLPGARLAAETISAVLGGEGTAVESLTARTGVILSKGRYEGRAAAASYQAAADRITLTGRPVLTDKQGGSARGDKLTFDLGDDKILVENEGQGRSTTIIKS